LRQLKTAVTKSLKILAAAKDSRYENLKILAAAKDSRYENLNPFEFCRNCQRAKYICKNILLLARMKIFISIQNTFVHFPNDK
jgi:phage pi2 protein 07